MATTEGVSAAFLAEDRSQVLVDTSIAFIVLTTVVLAARFYARRFQGLDGFHADDAFVTAAYFVNLGMCAVGISESSPPSPPPRFVRASALFPPSVI